ncbi:MAG: hypothetical protein OXE82_15100 [Rhodobacter sp.]|nr:hypothetical protein [Rhodobacter sp.]
MDFLIQPTEDRDGQAECVAKQEVPALVKFNDTLIAEGRKVVYQLLAELSVDVAEIIVGCPHVLQTQPASPDRNRLLKERIGSRAGVSSALMPIPPNL